MKISLDPLISFLLLASWMMGIVYAFEIGTWHGIASICTGPFYAWYLVTKHLMIYFGVLHGCF